MSTNAKCLIGTNETNQWSTYMNECRNSNDIARMNNFWTEQKTHYQDNLVTLRSATWNMMNAGDAQNSLMNLSGNSSGEVNKQITSLEKRKSTLKSEIENHRRRAEAHDRSFLDDVMQGTPQDELLPSLQDVALMMFSFGWVLMVCILTLIRTFQPGGSWRAGIFTFGILVVTTFCLYGLLLNVA